MNTTDPVELILSRLDGVRHSGKSWSAYCPAHDDRTASLSIGRGDDGRCLLTCHAGCDTKDVVAEIQLTMADLMVPDVHGNGSYRPANSVLDNPPQQEPKQMETLGQVVATYDYCDTNGRVLYQVRRHEVLDENGQTVECKKTFRQHHPDGNGGWANGRGDSELVPYRLPELVQSNGLKFIFEGEKDVNAAIECELSATCNVGGAGKWHASYSKWLKGCDVVIVTDNDVPGGKHALDVARSVCGQAKSVRILDLPDLPPKGDFSDWCDTAFGDAAEPADIRAKLVKLVMATEEWQQGESNGNVLESPPPDSYGPSLVCMADVDARPINWLWPGRVARGRITLMVGMPGAGKSFLTCDMAARISTGTPWPDGEPCEQGSVIFITAEDDPHDTIRPRLDAHHADVSKIHLLSGVERTEKGETTELSFTLADVDILAQALERVSDCRLVVVDPIGSFLGGRCDAHRDNEVRGVLAPIAKLAEKHGAAVLMVAHRRKGTATVADDMALGSRAFTGLARSVWHLSRDPENHLRRLLLPGKSNLAAEMTGLAFSIAGEPGAVKWEADPVAMSADDALAREMGTAGEQSATDEATDWLRDALAGGPKPSGELKNDAQRDGIAWRTVERSKAKLGVTNGPHGFGGPWMWALPDGGEATSVRQVSAESAKHNTLAETGETGPMLADSGADCCPRCNSTDFRETPIHDGQSSRRDYAACGRTL